MLLLDVPVDPTPPEARRWLIDELGKPEYTQAKPTLVDLVGQALADWFRSVFTGASGTPPLLAIGIGLAVVVAIIVIAVLLGGRVGLNRRTPAAVELFGVDERRSASRLRADAAAAAKRGDWTSATADAFRAVARAAAERETVLVVPGLTAHGFAARAGTAFPDEAEELDAAAAAFDTVRYLGASGTEEGYRRIEALDTRIEAARPAGVVV